jgi:hypothetical protein
MHTVMYSVLQISKWMRLGDQIAALDQSILIRTEQKTVPIELNYNILWQKYYGQSIPNIGSRWCKIQFLTFFSPQIKLMNHSLRFVKTFSTRIIAKGWVKFNGNPAIIVTTTDCDYASDLIKNSLANSNRLIPTKSLFIPQKHQSPSLLVLLLLKL